ncbi:hypothetical protein CMV_009753 [Castanea mollissima]|uniref:Ribulose bisphosphate carboxylase small subunit n=1 Tax=Castanea mollissima TaxID=60419 RepID=A0A8J4R542_9ROSI|nr:hypothetical protein CMV_009753 [Castanea mollissima]
MSAGIFTYPVAVSGFVGLKSNSTKLPAVRESIGWSQKTISNGSKTYCMKTWNPINNKKFETLSYLPPLTEDSIAKQVDYMIKMGWIPCLEFDEVGSVRRENSRMPGYYDGRSAKRLTQMLIFAAWLLTTRNKFSAWPLSFRNPPPVLKVYTHRPITDHIKQNALFIKTFFSIPIF